MLESVIREDLSQSNRCLSDCLQSILELARVRISSEERPCVRIDDAELQVRSRQISKRGSLYMSFVTNIPT